MYLYNRPTETLPTVSAFYDMRVGQIESGLPPGDTALIRRAFRDDCDIVFTHADLYIENILVHDGHISAILN
jgi:hypothetical protein